MPAITRFSVLFTEFFRVTERNAIGNGITQERAVASNFPEPTVISPELNIFATPGSKWENRDSALFSYFTTVGEV